jgi:hypothetical protein
VVDRIGPVAIVAPSDEAYRQAAVFAGAATAERPIAVFRQQEPAARWLVDIVEDGLRTDEVGATWPSDLRPPKAD